MSGDVHGQKNYDYDYSIYAHKYVHPYTAFPTSMFSLTTDWHDWFAFGYGLVLRWMFESIGYHPGYLI